MLILDAFFDAATAVFFQFHEARQGGGMGKTPMCGCNFGEKNGSYLDIFRSLILPLAFLPLSLQLP